MKSLQEDLKTGKFKQAYLLFGEEAYLRQQYKDKLIQALNPDGDTMNFTRYEGKGIEVREMIDLCETMPFFAEIRVILVENSGFFKNKCEELADYMKSLPDYIRMVFVEEEVDKRSRMYKAVKACGRITEFARQDEKSLMRWAAGILGREGRKIRTSDMELFLTKTGTDMGNIRMELEKLITYTQGRDIVTAEDIEAVCTTQTANKIFDMVRAVTERNQKRALELYYDLLTLKEPPMRILFLLAKQFHQLFLAKKMSEEGVAQPEIASPVRSTVFCGTKYFRLCPFLFGCGASESRGRLCGGRGSSENRTASGCTECGASDCKIQFCTVSRRFLRVSCNHQFYCPGTTQRKENIVKETIVSVKCRRIVTGRFQDIKSYLFFV